MGYLKPPIEVDGIIRTDSTKPFRSALGAVVFLSMGIVLFLASSGLLGNVRRVSIWMVNLLGGMSLSIGLVLLYDVVEKLRIRVRLSRAGTKWQKDYPWETDFSPDDSQRLTKGLVALLLFLGALHMTFGVPLVRSLLLKGVPVAEKGQSGGAILRFSLGVLLLGVIVIGILRTLVRLLVTGRRYKKARFYYDSTPPFRPGGVIEGRIVIDPRLAREAEVTLWGIREVVTSPSLGPGSRSNRLSFVKKGFYQDTRKVRARPDGTIPVSFQLPEDAPGTCLSCSEVRYWELHLRIPGAEYKAFFLVPVYE